MPLMTSGFNQISLTSLVSWSDTAGLAPAHLKKGQTVNTSQHTPSRLPAPLKPLLRWLWNSDREQRCKPAARSKLHPNTPVPAGPPQIRVPQEILGRDGVSGFVCHNVQSDWGNIPAHYAVNPSPGRNLTLHFSWGRSRIFLKMFFSPVWQKIPQSWYTQIRDVEQHTFVYFCSMTQT